MAVKKKSVAVEKKLKTAKKATDKKKSSLADSEVCFSRRKKGVVENLLNLGKAPEYEVFLIGNKRFYRKRTKIRNCDELSDAELIEIAQRENREVYSDLFKRYQRKLFVYIYRLTRDRDETEDILQNVFAKTYKNIKNFDLTRKFSSWIYRIAHNEAVNHLKRKSKRYTVSWEDITTSKDKLDTASSEEPIEAVWLHQEITQEITEALKKLPKPYRQILYMRYFREYSYQQISKALGKPVNTVGTIINRAKKKLLEVVKEDKEDRKEKKT